MKNNSIPQTLGIRPAPGLIKDRFFRVAIAAGLIVSVVISVNGLATVPAGIGVSGLLSVLLWYPFIEELAFRGVVQGTLAEYSAGRRSLLGISVANLAASFAFVLWHLLYQAGPMILMLVMPSLVFGFFRDRYQSLLPALLLHSLYNGFFFLAHRYVS